MCSCLKARWLYLLWCLCSTCLQAGWSLHYVSHSVLCPYSRKCFVWQFFIFCFPPTEWTDVQIDSGMLCWRWYYSEKSEWDGVLLSFSRRVFILGPSHHVHLTCCGLSPAEIYRTPLYDLKIDQKGIWLVLQCCYFHSNVRLICHYIVSGYIYCI